MWSAWSGLLTGAALFVFLAAAAWAWVVTADFCAIGGFGRVAFGLHEPWVFNCRQPSLQAFRHGVKVWQAVLVKLIVPLAIVV